MSVHEIKRNSLLNIGAGLRELADWVDQNPDAIRTVIIVSAANDRVVTCHGYGERCSPVESLGWLMLAQQRVLGDREAPATDLGTPA